MSTAAPIPPITGTATVAVPVDKAFDLFTGSIASWWPYEFHIGQSDLADVVLEPHVGGEAVHGTILGGGGWAFLLDGFAASVEGRQ